MLAHIQFFHFLLGLNENRGLGLVFQSHFIFLKSMFYFLMLKPFLFQGVQ